MDGYGAITWWGFSPACDLQEEGCDISSRLKNLALRGNNSDTVNILLVGAGDLRHVLMTMSRTHRHSSKHINFYVMESSLELYARDLLFMTLALEKTARIGLQEKTEFFLELFGNLLIRQQTLEYVQKMSSMFIKMVTDFEYMEKKMPIFDMSNLKFKERDMLEAIFKFWRNPDISTYDAEKCWNLRLRQFLGTRYDAIPNVFDWDYNMKLSERGAGVIGGKNYANWRHKGTAFEIREGTYETPNRTLASGMVFKQDGERHARRGFWGDIVVSPYIAHGIRSDNASFFKKQNKMYIKTSQDVSEYNIMALLYELANKVKYPMPDEASDNKTSQGATLTEITEEEEESNTSDKMDEQGNNPMDLEYEPFTVDNTKIIFLPISSVSELPKKSKYKQLFDIVYFSNSLVHNLNPELASTFADEAAVLIETAKYMVTLSDDQTKEFVKKISTLATNLGCKLEDGVDAESDSLARFKYTRT